MLKAETKPTAAAVRALELAQRLQSAISDENQAIRANRGWEAAGATVDSIQDKLDAITGDVFGRAVRTRQDLELVVVAAYGFVHQDAAGRPTTRCNDPEEADFYEQISVRLLTLIMQHLGLAPPSWDDKPQRSAAYDPSKPSHHRTTP
jgi:hypothetical protein